MISVILPTYNRASMVTRALESVLAQTEGDYEIIVIDDGSTDETPQVLKPYEGVARITRQANRGCAAARNEGIRLARGEYLAFLDSDDYWEPNKLTLQKRILDSNPDIGLVCSDFSFYENDRCVNHSYISTYCPVVRLLGRNFFNSFTSKSEISHNGTAFDFYQGNMFAVELMGYFTLTSTVMIRKSCLTDIGVFNSSYRLGSDYELFLRFCFHYPIGFMDIPTARFGRFHADQLSRSENAYLQMQTQLRMNLDIEHHFPEHFRQHPQLLNKSRAIRYLAVGMEAYHIGKYDESVQCLWHSIKHRPLSKQAYLQLFRASAKCLTAKFQGPTERP